MGASTIADVAPGRRVGAWRVLAPDGVSWTNVTASRAMTAAFLGQRDEALARLRWLDQHRTAAGSLPEKVLPTASPPRWRRLPGQRGRRDHGGPAGLLTRPISALVGSEVSGS